MPQEMEGLRKQVDEVRKNWKRPPVLIGMLRAVSKLGAFTCVFGTEETENCLNYRNPKKQIEEELPEKRKNSRGNPVIAVAKR